MIDTFQPGPESKTETGNSMIVHFFPNNPKIISHCPLHVVILFSS